MLEEPTMNTEFYKNRFFNINEELPHHLYKLKLQAATYKINQKLKKNK